MQTVIERTVDSLLVPHSSNLTPTPSNTIDSPRRVSFDPDTEYCHNPSNMIGIPHASSVNASVSGIPRTYTQEILREQMKQSFAQKEIKLILSGIISLSVSVGCIVLIGVTKGENCALNNGAFAILSAVAGGWLTLLSNVSSSAAKSRSNSVS